MSVQTESWPRPHRITVEEYYRMAEVGLLAPDARVELIEGEIIDMAPIGDRHVAIVNSLARRLILAVEGHALASVQGSVRLSFRSEPQPDLAVLRLRDDEYRKGLPGPADILLIIEVSDTTLRYDRDVKSKFYARHCVPELWVVDLVHEQLLVFRDPRDGEYAEQLTVGAGVMEVPSVAIKLDLAKLF
jgi:Uma2 family endonuclease